MHYRNGDGSFDSAENITKDSSTPWITTTGAFKKASTNNIYDMAGNAKEQTMSGGTYANGNPFRRVGGSTHDDNGVVDNYECIGDPVMHCGFKVSLYIK